MAVWQEGAFSRFADVDAPTLVVLVHGLAGSGDQLGSVADAAVEALGAADVYVPTLAFAGRLGVLSATPPASVVGELVAAVDSLDAARMARLGAPYARIILIGYSMGALIARRVAIAAHGETADAPFEAGFEAFRERRGWAERIERVVLLGGISRGWAPRSAASWSKSALWGLFSFLATLTPAHRGVLMESRFGLPFPVQTRLQWLALCRAGGRDLPVVQLLGSRDDVVSPDDMIDVAVDGVNRGSHVLLDMSSTAHADAVDMRPEAPARRALLRDALTLDMAALAKHPDAISSALLADGKTPEPEEGVTDVVFVVHGIRDKGFWTSKVARAIKREAAASPLPDGTPRHVRSMTESYGYLAMLPFLWIGVRRAKAAWLMDRYVEARARYPRARFHFVGHSNGTYLAARALSDYPAALFERVVFAGSVVRTRYDWRRLMDAPRPQVRGLLNYVASGDLVVGIFPAALGLVDLGGAGHAGFRDIAGPLPRSDMARVVPKRIGAHDCFQVHYARGGHGAGIVESQWDEIARFIVCGAPPRAVNADYVGRQSPAARLLGAAPPFGFLLVVTIYALLALGIALVEPFLLIPLALLTLLVLLRV